MKNLHHLALLYKQKLTREYLVLLNERLLLIRVVRNTPSHFLPSFALLSTSTIFLNYLTASMKNLHHLALLYKQNLTREYLVLHNERLLLIRVHRKTPSHVLPSFALISTGTIFHHSQIHQCSLYFPYHLSERDL